MILSLILAFTAPAVKPNIDYIPQYSYYYNIAKNIDLSEQVKDKPKELPKIENTVVVNQPESFLIDTDQKLSKDEIIALIRDYSIKYNVDPERSVRIAKCESGFNPFAKSKSGKFKGIYQFMDSTWFTNAKRLGLENPDVFNVEHNIQVATYMFSLNQYHQWGCKG